MQPARGSSRSILKIGLTGTFSEQKRETGFLHAAGEAGKVRKNAK
jgi:hypothetical protein